jgi:catechol 2,3-dioxygenase-like lactoylglutathione lyase family enzyme
MLRLRHITFACAEPRRLAEFSSGVLGYEPQERGESWAAVDMDGGGPELFFNLRPKSPTIELPVHLDVNVPDREAAVERLVRLGAKIVVTKTQEAGELKETWTVMRDPEGNGFCVQGARPAQAPPVHRQHHLRLRRAAPRRRAVLGARARLARAGDPGRLPADAPRRKRRRRP